MSLIASEAELAKAAAYLAKHDPVLAPVVTWLGHAPFGTQRLLPRAVDSIISQQLSIHAARSIEGDFVTYSEASFLLPNRY